MSDAMKGNVMEQLEKNGIDVTATLDNIIKKFPNLIVYVKQEANSNEKAPDENESNKEQVFHKPENNSNSYEKSDDSNKCCDRCKCENEEKQVDTEDEHHHCACLFMGPMDPQTALMINVLEGLSAINDNIIEILNQLHENAPKEIKEVAELKTCKIRTGITKKQLNKIMDKHDNEICDFIDETLDTMTNRIIGALKDINGNIGSKKSK